MDEVFTMYFNHLLKVYNLEENVVCSTLKISKETLNRWMSGLSAPHPRGRASVYDALSQIGEQSCRGDRMSDLIKHCNCLPQQKSKEFGDHSPYCVYIVLAKMQEKIEKHKAENIKLRGVLNEMRCRRGKCAVINGVYE